MRGIYLPTMRKKRKNKTWNKENGQINMAFWNPWSLCNERFKYCQAIQYDVLGLGELHNVQNKKGWKSRRWITSQDAEVDAQGRCTDPAAGVGIMLSPRFADRIMAQGSEGSRIVWVRIRGSVCPLVIICTYIPHKYKKTAPTANDTIANLLKLLSDYQ